MTGRKTILILIAVLFTIPSEAGTDLPADTLKLVEGSWFDVAGQKVRIRQDTTIILDPGTEYDIRYPRDGNFFFDSLQVRASRKQWTHRLHNIIVKEPRRLAAEDTVHTRLSTEPFEMYAGKTIRHIRFEKYYPFGTSLRNPSPEPPTRMEKFGNELHRITQDEVFRKYLLFREGEFLNPNELADNERLIRRLPFIQDAFILISETSPGSDSVDVRIVTRDAFFLGLGGEVYDLSSGNLEIFDPNLLGMGQELHTVFHWDGEQDRWLGNEMIYIAHNLDGSFIDAKISYANVFETESYRIGLDRAFFTQDIKFAGAFELERTQTERSIRYLDSLSDPVAVKYNLLDGWIGRSILLGKRNNITQNRINLIFATRLYHRHYIRRPQVTKTLLHYYHNRTGWLTSLSFSSESFFKSNLIRDFGRPEDIPQGVLFSVILGPEVNEFHSRLYGGIHFSQGRYLGNLGYLYTRLEGGGFLKKIDFLEQGVINLEGDYFSNLLIINRFKIRHFLSSSYVRGIRRFEDEFIDLRGDNGIRGFESRDVTGTQRLAVKYEATAFTPFYLYGFRFVLFGFADAAIIGPDTEPLGQGRFHTGFGLGVRVRNERLVFETISIRLGFYPNHPDVSMPLLLDVAGRERLHPEHFRVKKPRIIGYE